MYKFRKYPKTLAEELASKHVEDSIAPGISLLPYDMAADVLVRWMDHDSVMDMLVAGLISEKVVRFYEMAKHKG